jgi:hypothetical protein
MSEHQFVLNIDVADGIEPQVRMWIDDQQTSDLSSEHEVALVRNALSAWSAEFDASGPFIYRIGIVASPGSRWSLVFRSVGEEPQELLFDSDELTMTKEWLVGTCEPFEATAVRGTRESGLGFQLLSS